MAKKVAAKSPEELARLNELKKIRRRIYLVKNAEKVRARQRAYNIKKAEKVRAIQRAYNTKHAEKLKAYQKQYRIQNTEKIRANKLEWLKNNPEKRQAVLVAFRKRHAKKLYASQAAWREANRDRKRATNMAWVKANPEKDIASKIKYRRSENGNLVIANIASSRRAQKNGSIATVTNAEMAAIKKAAKGLCFYCRQPRRLTFDHIVALRNGGPHTKENLVMACKSCNCSKRSKPVGQFINEKGFVYVEIPPIQLTLVAR